jgi:L-fuconolactonase
MRIDAHQFFTPKRLPEDLAIILARGKFDGSVAIQHGDTPDDARRLLEIATHHDFVKVALTRLHPAALDEFQKHPKFRGVIVGAPPGKAALDDLAGRGVTLDIEPSVPFDVLNMAPPSLPIILVHLHFPLTDPDAWAKDMTHAAARPNTFVKISGLTTLHLPHKWDPARFRPFVSHALKVFGPDRVMFGSDWPRSLELADCIWKECLAAFTQALGAQPMDVREKLLGGVAAKVYRV